MTELNKRAFDTSFEAHQGLLHRFAKKGYGRLMQSYVSIDYEDVYQEMCLTYVKAVKKFDPEKGISFTAYLGRAIWNEFNKFAEREILEKTELNLSSFESLNDIAQDEDVDIYETIDSGAFTPEELFMAKQEAREKNKLCGPMAKYLVGQLMKPSQRIVDAINEQGEGEERKRVGRNVTMAFIVSQHDEIDKDLARVAKRQLNNIYGVNFR